MMLIAKIECDLPVETLSAHISQLAEVGFTVWLHKKKTQAVFKVTSIQELRRLAQSIERVGFRCKFLSVAEQDEA